MRRVGSDEIVDLSDESFGNVDGEPWQFGFEINEEKLLRDFGDGYFWRDCGSLLPVEGHAGSDGGEDFAEIVFDLVQGLQVVALAEWTDFDVNVRLGLDLTLHACSSFEGVRDEREGLTATLDENWTGDLLRTRAAGTRSRWRGVADRHQLGADAGIAATNKF